MAIEGDAGVTVTEATVGVVLELMLLVEPPPQLARKTQDNTKTVRITGRLRRSMARE